MKQKITLNDLAPLLAGTEGLTPDEAEAFVRAYFEVISEALTEEKFVKIKGFGTFKLVTVSERESVNINTGERFRISSHTKVTFTPENSLKELVNRPFAHFEAVDLSDETSTDELEEIDREAEALAEAQEQQEAKENEEAAQTTTAENSSESTPEEEAVEDAPEESESENGQQPAQASNAADEPSPAQQTDSASQGTAEEAAENTEEGTTAEAEGTTENEAGHQAEPETAAIVLPQQTEAPQAEELPKEPVPADDNDTATPVEHKTGSEPCTTGSSVTGEACEPEAVEETRQENSHETPTAANQSATTSEHDTPHIDYTYRETGRQWRRNPWKIAALILGLIILTGGSYFAGYFRLLCPCSLPIVERRFVTPEPAAPTSTPQPSTKVKPMPAPTAPQTAAPQSATESAARVEPATPAISTTQKPAASPAPKAATDAGKAAAGKAKEPVKKGPTYHTVEVGDNLSRLSRRYYGSDKYVNRILEANGLKNADNIVLGMKLIIPAP